MIVNVAFCRKGLCSLLQPATSATLIQEQHFLVERTSALAVRLAAKVPLGKRDLLRFALRQIGKILLGKEDLPKSATAPTDWPATLVRRGFR